MISRETAIGVVGAGAMGAGIAQVAAAAGHRVLLYDALDGAAEKGKSKTADALVRLVEKGKMPAEERDALLSRIEVCSDLGPMAGAGLIIEAVIEDREVKKDLFRQLDSITPQSILASNTSSLSITELASVLKDPSRFAGMHFFNPAPVLPLVEVVRGLRTSDETIETLVETARAWGKTPVVAKNAPGFIVNKGARPFYGEALKFLEEGGADAATIDSLMRAAGFKMGPFELIDLIGLDVNLAVSRQMWQAYYGEPRYQPSMLVEEMVAAGYLGRKSGRGFYDYSEGATKPEPKVMPRQELSVPQQLTVVGFQLGEVNVLVELWKARGIEVIRREADAMPHLEVGPLRLALTHGSLAAEASTGQGDWVLFDLSFDYERCNHIAIAPAAYVSEQNIAVAAAMFQMLDKQVSVVRDLPGLLVARTAAMLLNEAADTVMRQIASPKEVDIAMQKGLSYPLGLLEWYDMSGTSYQLQLLDNMQAAYRDSRYRSCIQLRQSAVSGERYFDA